MFLSEWREFPFGALPCRKKNLMTARVSMLLKSRASLTYFRACFLPGRAKDLSVPRYTAAGACNSLRIFWIGNIHTWCFLCSHICWLCYVLCTSLWCGRLGFLFRVTCLCICSNKSADLCTAIVYLNLFVCTYSSDMPNTHQQFSTVCSSHSIPVILWCLSQSYQQIQSMKDVVWTFWNT